MKVGILTFPNSPSYGASLQMFALYNTIQNFGYTPEVINYQNNYMNSKQHMEKKRIKVFIQNIISYKTKRGFKKFEYYMDFFPLKAISDQKQLKNLSKNYDFIIVGSDQVWNPSITNEDLSYFLNFCEKEKSISYAASFGVNSIDMSFQNKIRPCLKEIKSLSVREYDGQQIIESLIQKKVEIVLDPTFLIEKNKWIDLIGNRKIIKNEYIFAFVFNETIENSIFLEKLQIEKQLPIVMISDNPLNISTKKKKYVSGVTPIDFLSLIANASFVFTDSFHGSAFSIILEKEFFVSLSTKTNSRLETLLESMNLENRNIKADPLKHSIDYHLVRKNIKSLRENSMNFLKNALKKETENID